MKEVIEKRVLWAPLIKSNSGKFLAVLSDSLPDLENEMMSKELLESWAQNKSLPGLTDHINEFGGYLCDWKNFRVIESDGHSALVAEPHWLISNPKAKMARDMLEVDGAENIGISIGAIPEKSIEKKIDDVKFTVWTKARLLEASLTPIPTNQRARFHIAKSLVNSAYPDDKKEIKAEPELTKPAKLDRCVADLMADPDFKPKEGKTKKESAFAVCNAQIKSASAEKEEKMENKKADLILEAIKSVSERIDKIEKSEPEEPKEESKAEPKEEVVEEKSYDRKAELKSLQSTETKAVAEVTSNGSLSELLALKRGLDYNKLK